MSNCIESVFTGWHSYPCARANGYGKDAAYCKQHAAKHPADDQQYATAWEARSSYVREIEYQSRTDKTITLAQGDRERIFGTYSRYFFDRDAAYGYVTERLRQRLESQEREIINTRSALADIEREWRIK